MHMGTAFADRKLFITKDIGGYKLSKCICFYQIGKMLRGSLGFKFTMIQLEINSYSTTVELTDVGGIKGD